MSISLATISASAGASAPSLPTVDFHKPGAHRGGHAHGSTRATTEELLSGAAGTQPGDLPVGATSALLRAGAHLTESSGAPVAAGSAGSAGSQRGALINTQA